MTNLLEQLISTALCLILLPLKQTSTLLTMIQMT